MKYTLWKRTVGKSDEKIAACEGLESARDVAAKVLLPTVNALPAIIVDVVARRADTHAIAKVFKITPSGAVYAVGGASC